jgi:hypothetical protein
MPKVLAGLAAVVLVVLGARYLASHRSTPAPETPPPPPVDEIPDAGPG